MLLVPRLERYERDQIKTEQRDARALRSHRDVHPRSKNFIFAVYEIYKKNYSFSRVVFLYLNLTKIANFLFKDKGQR